MSRISIQKRCIHEYETEVSLSKNGSRLICKHCGESNKPTKPDDESLDSASWVYANPIASEVDDDIGYQSLRHQLREAFKSGAYYGESRAQDKVIDAVIEFFKQSRFLIIDASDAAFMVKANKSRILKGIK